jgi:hypothetical protein
VERRGLYAQASVTEQVLRKEQARVVVEARATLATYAPAAKIIPLRSICVSNSMLWQHDCR